MATPGAIVLDISVDLGKNVPADRNRVTPNTTRPTQTRENSPAPIHIQLRAGFLTGSMRGSDFRAATDAVRAWDFDNCSGSIVGCDSREDAGDIRGCAIATTSGFAGG
jgi:hypothetical protein